MDKKLIKKMSKEETKDFFDLLNKKIKIETDIDIMPSIYKLLEEINPELFFKVLGFHYVNDKLSYATTMMKFLAQQKDVNLLEFGAVCTYVSNHYKQLSKIAIKDLGKRLEEAEKNSKI